MKKNNEKKKNTPYQNSISGFEPTPKVTSLNLKTKNKHGVLSLAPPALVYRSADIIFLKGFIVEI